MVLFYFYISRRKTSMAQRVGNLVALYLDLRMKKKILVVFSVMWKNVILEPIFPGMF